jgi:hypothetical protein
MGLNGTTTGASSSAALKSPETRQARTPRGLGSPELVRTGEGGPANSMVGFRL